MYNIIMHTDVKHASTISVNTNLKHSTVNLWAGIDRLYAYYKSRAFLGVHYVRERLYARPSAACDAAFEVSFRPHSVCLCVCRATK